MLIFSLEFPFSSQFGALPLTPPHLGDSRDCLSEVLANTRRTLLQIEISPLYMGVGCDKC